MHVRAATCILHEALHRPVTVVPYIPGFFQGGGGGEHSPPPPPPLGSWLPPLRGPPVTYSYSITFDIVHVESFPLLMVKAVLNEYFAHFTLLNFRVLCRRKQSLSLLVCNSFCYLSSSIHVQAPCIHCVVDLSLQIEADSLFTGLFFLLNFPTIFATVRGL